MTATVAEVEAFLKAYRDAAEQFGITWWNTAENKKYMNESGNTKEDVKDIIYKLKYKNYNKGPEPDDNAIRPSGEVWVFEVEHEGFELYVKLKLLHVIQSPEPVVCMSFHEQNRNMVTPLRPVRNLRRGGR